MPLGSRLFTDPPDPALEACLVDDGAHIFTGARGTSVACIQVALSLLSDDAVFLVIDGVQVRLSKSDPVRFLISRTPAILGPGQASPDDIVGRRTPRSLDDETSIFEEQAVASDDFVSTTVLGAPHDHSACSFSGFAAPGSGGRVNHFGLPVNPLPGRSINTGGGHKTDYLLFEDFATGAVVGLPRPFTHPGVTCRHLLTQR